MRQHGDVGYLTGIIATSHKGLTVSDATVHPPCVICGGGVLRRDTETARQFRRRRICSHACDIEQRSQASEKGKYKNSNSPGLMSHVHWANELVEVDYGGGFGRQNVVEKPNYGAIPPKPVNHPHSLIGCAAGWVVKSA